VDAACAAEVDLARATTEELTSPADVGEHLGVRAEADRVVTHFFASHKPGYYGWRWAVTVARAARAKNVTVDEVVLVPGDDALLAPVWLPWRERLRPGDLGPGDLLPTELDDERLAPGFTASDDTDYQMVWEPGIGRARVLSAIGREEAADRWYAGDSGPQAPLASAAPAQCSTCGFFVPLAGDLKQAFGVCANEYAPDDGRVVSVDHGCGAHSEAEIPSGAPEPPPPIVDDLGYELLTEPQGPVADGTEPADEPLGIS
jgi:hypothetical protein